MNRSRSARLIPIVALVALLAIAIAGAVAVADDAPRPPRVGLAAGLAGWLQAEDPEGVTADLQITSQLVESGGLADGSGILGRAAGRIWVASDGRARLDLRTMRGDAVLAFDGERLTLYDAPGNTVYRLDAPGSLRRAASDEMASSPLGGGANAAALASLVATLSAQTEVTGPEPGSIAGQPAYTLRIAPRRDAGLLGAAEVAWDAVHGVPLRLALYAAGGDPPVLEVRATRVEYGPVDARALDFEPPADAPVVDLTARLDALRERAEQGLDGVPVEGPEAVARAVPFALRAPDALVGLPRQGVRLVAWDGEPAAVSLYGRGLGQIVVLQQPATAGDPAAEDDDRLLPRVAIEGASGWELPTALGTVLRVERDGVLYTLAGSVPPAAAEAALRELLAG